MAAPDPDGLHDLGKRLDEIQARQARYKTAPPASRGLQLVFGTELVAALMVGAVGWGWTGCSAISVSHPPWGMMVFFVLGAAAGIRDVMRAAQRDQRRAPAKDDEEK